jgi:polyphosphate kinase
MPRRKKPPAEIDFSNPEYYFNREMSWLEFNNRVLHEAFDPRTPLLERLKFLAIFSSNLDEYCMVRVAALKEQVAAQVSKLSYDGKTAQQQLELINQRLRPMVVRQHRHFSQALCPQLAGHGVYLLNYIDLNQEQQTYLQVYFEQQVFPVLTPLAIDPSHPFPHISNLSLNLAVAVRDRGTGDELFAQVKVPNVLPRFILLPTELCDVTTLPASRSVVWMGVPLEQVIAHNLELLFPGLDIQAYHPFRITRNADLDLDEDEAEDLLLAIEQELRKRRIGGSVVRMEIDNTMPDHIRDLLMSEMGLTLYDVYQVDGPLGLRDLMALMALPLPALKDPPWSPVVPPRLKRVNERDIETPPTEIEADFFAILRKQDLLLHHPYYSFTSSVQRFIAEAAHDPDVLAIKMTLYRTSGDSPIVQSLITAAENGKQVAALVELKARFDEENNINWARQLESAGVHVVYGLVGLKTHTKLVLVVRREADRIRRYVHIGTGNYNPKTARLYTDIGLLSSREELGADLTDLFNFLTGYSRQQIYRQVVVAPANLRDRMITLIHREIEHQRQGVHSRIVAKMNALVDPQLIAALYEASQAGVQIDLIVRGICCLRPGLPGISDHIRVISIVGRFLEHSRIFYFHNGGAEEILIGSADWMPRNLDRRVEAVVPIVDATMIKDIQEILGIMLADNRHAWDLKSDGRYVQRQLVSNHPDQSSQKLLMEMTQPSAGA